MKELEELINEYEGLILNPINNGKYELFTINGWVPFKVHDYLFCHFDVLGKEGNRIVFK